MHFFLFDLEFLKKWLREHRTYPYPNHHEKMQLAHQSSITYDQVTTWFNNARAILRRRHTKLRPSLEITEENELNEPSALFHQPKPISAGKQRTNKERKSNENRSF